MMVKIKLYFCLGLMIISALMPIKVLATDETDNYSNNEIYLYNKDDCDGTVDSSSGAIGEIKETDNLREWVDTYGQAAFDASKKYGIPYEVNLAVGIRESGWGKSELTRKANNFFGIKADPSWHGAHITMPTKEYSHGSWITVNAPFRKYPTVAEGWEGYGQFLTEQPRYKKALKYPGEPIKFLTEVWEAGYATSPTYVQNIGKVVNAISKYIAKTKKWPPSSEVAKTSSPTGGSPTAASGTTADSTVDCTGGSGTEDTTADNEQPPNTVKRGKGWVIKDGEDYSAVKCAEGTTDKGVTQHPTTKYTIRKCQTPIGIVASIISKRAIDMVNAAKTDGVTLTGTGWRDSAQQIRTWDKCAPNCKGMVASPGNSNHERGLATDMSGISKVGSGKDYEWLVKNAKKFGYINYWREGWHWSMSGG